MSDVECVIDGCDYSADSVKSVEAHISGTSEGDHIGSGMMYRDELVAQKEGALNEGNVSASSEASEEDVEQAETDDEEGEDTSEEPAEPASAAAVPAVAGAGLLGSVSAGSGGGRNWGFILGVALLAVLVLAVATADDQEGEDTEPVTASQPATPTEAAQQGGGLHG